MPEKCREMARNYADAMRRLHDASIDFQKEKRDSASRALQSVEYAVIKFVEAEDWHPIKEIIDQVEKGSSGDAVNRIHRVEELVTSEFLSAMMECTCPD
jgi:ribosomal 50S subunit-associated protein YjgA (DUF615 family)